MFNLGLLSDAALTGLTDTEKESMQKQATQQFLIGSLLSGDPGVGFRSASEIPATSLNMQKMIRDSQIAQQQQQELAGFKQKYAPTTFQAGQQSFVNAPTRTSTDYGPSPQAAQRQIDRLNAPIDYNRALSDSLRLSGNPAQPQIRETLKSMQPTYINGLRVDNQGNIVGSLPQEKDLIQTKYNNKTGMFEAQPVSGALQAKVGTALPEVPVGAQLSFSDAGLLQTSMLPGMRNLSQQLAFDKRFGEGQAALQTTPTNVVDIPTGRQKRVTEAQALGMPTSLSASETQAYEGYKPVREAAFKGFQAATSSDASLQNLQNIINRGAFEPGKFAGFKSEAAAIATGLGIGGDRAKAVAVDSPLFLQSVADVASANIQDLVGATSDKDIQFSASRGPQITNPKEAVQYYLDLTRVANQRKKDQSHDM